MALSVKALQEKLGELHDKAAALNNLAKNEKRDLTADEQKEFDGLMAQYQDVKEKQLPRAEWLEKEQERLAQARTNPSAPERADEPNDDNAPQNRAALPRAAKIVIPPQSLFRFGALKAYKGQHAEQKAYLAGRFFLATLGQHEASAKWCKDQGIDVKFHGALKESSSELGGYMVPTEVEQAIIDLREQYGVFRQHAKRSPMASDTKIVPVRTGGVTAYFVGEGQTITDSDKAWDNVKLIAKKLAALVIFSNEFGEDAIISLGDDLTGEIAYAFAVKEDQCGFVGTGASTYGGIVGVVNAVAAGSIVTAVSGNVSFETLDLADFESCVGKLPEYPGIDPKWYISKAGWAASMMRLADAAGGNTSMEVAGGPPRKEFLGYEVVVSQVLNSTLGSDASAPKAIFGDLNMGALLGDRRGMSIAFSDQRYFETDQQAIKGTERFDINIHDVGTSSAAGSLVVLKTAAS